MKNKILTLFLTFVFCVVFSTARATMVIDPAPAFVNKNLPNNQGVVIAPEVKETTPSANQKAVHLHASIEITFDKNMNRNSVEKAFHFMECNEDIDLPGTIAWPNDQDSHMTFTPDENMIFGEEYCVAISQDAKDWNGTPLNAPYSFAFTAETFEENKDWYVQKYAPEIHLASYGEKGKGAGNDWTRPANIEWYLNTGHSDGGDLIGSSLRFNHTLGCKDHTVLSVGSLTPDNISAQSHPRSASCEHTGSIKTSDTDNTNPHEYNGLSKEMDAFFFTQPRKGTGDGNDYDKMHHGIYGGPHGDNPSLFAKDGAGEKDEDLIDKGIWPDQAPPVGRWVMYVYINDGDKRLGSNSDIHKEIQYWLFYAYNDSTGTFNHESDFEHITVALDEQGQPYKYFFSAHNHGYIFEKDTSCSSGFRSATNLNYDGTSMRFCMRVSDEDDGFHAIAYAADGSHANFPTYGGAWIADLSRDNTTQDGPVWKGWKTIPGAANYEIVDDNTPWIQYAGIWGEIGSNEHTSGKRGPKFQNWGEKLERDPYGDL